MTAVASATLLTIVGAGVYVAGALRPDHRTADLAPVDCRRILSMIDEAFSDRRMSASETTTIEDASRAMRATATPASAQAVARCVGLPVGTPAAWVTDAFPLCRARSIRYRPLMGEAT